MFTEQENEFLRAFHDCSLGKFQHKDHIQLAWLVLKHHDFAQSHREISDGLRRFASNQGVPGRYHETLTTFWVGLVDHAIQQAPDIDDFETFLDKFPMLLDSSLPSRHWRNDTLWSDSARSRWVEPDLMRLYWK